MSSGDGHSDQQSSINQKRRTLLKSLPAAAIGSGVLTSSASAQESSQAEICIQQSFEEGSVGDEVPSDPFYLFNDAGLHEVSDIVASTASQSFHTADAPLGDPSAIAVKVDLTDYQKIKHDVYAENNNPFFGNIKVSVDGAGFNNEKTNLWDFDITQQNRTGNDPGGYQNQWLYDAEVDISDLEGERPLTFWVDGDNNAFWDNIRLICEGKSASLTVTNVELVQRVRDMRVSGAPTEVDDPPLLENLNAGVVFDLEGSNLSELPSQVPFRVEYGGISRAADEFTVPGTLLSNDLQDGDFSLQDFANLIQTFVNGSDQPVFNLDDSLDTITVTVGDSETSFNSSLELEPLEDRTPSPPPSESFNIGIVALNYSDDNIVEDGEDPIPIVRDEIESQIVRALEILPTERINIYIHDNVIEGVESLPVISAQDEVTVDSLNVREVLEDTLPVDATFSVEDGSAKNLDNSISDFDATIGLAASNYFEFHNYDTSSTKETKGRHPAYASETDPDLQPPAGIMLETEGSNTLLVHEVGHHLIGEAYDGTLASEEDGDIHASETIESDYFALTSGTFDIILVAAESWMTPDVGTAADSLGITTMIENNLNPVPPEGTKTGLSAIRLAVTTTDSGVEIFKFAKTGAQSISDTTQGALDVEILDSTGDILSNQKLSKTVGQFNSVNVQQTDTSSLYVGNIDFPKETYKFRISDGSVTEEVIPIEKTLRQGFENLPDKAFKRAAKGRRKALNNKLDVVQKQLERKKFRPATNKLQNDIRKNTENWVKEDFEAKANEITKEELLASIDDMIERSIILQR